MLKRLASAIISDSFRKSFKESIRNWRAIMNSQSWLVVHLVAWKALKLVAALQLVRGKTTIKMMVRKMKKLVMARVGFQ
jgi:hypothetical protein